MIDPNLIFFPPYLACGALILFAWAVLMEGSSCREAWRTLAARRVWLTRSTLVDVGACMIYVALVKAPLAAAEGATFLFTLGATGDALQKIAPGQFTATMPVAVEAFAATGVTMLAIDFAAYLTHRAMHAIPWLWRVHAWHHGATALTPLTTYRQHPAEPFILGVARAAAAGGALALFQRVFWQSTPVMTIAGLGAGFFFYMFTVNLHHAPIAVRYPHWLRALVLSPHIHHLHHSAAPQHRNQNYGVVFSVWDQIFRTYRDEEFDRGALAYGLGDDGEA